MFRTYKFRRKTMKKRIIVIAAVLLIVLPLCSCSSIYQTGNRITGGVDVQTFHYAYVHLGDKTIEGAVTQWRDYNNSDVVQVMIDGKYYLTHYTNVILVSDPNLGGMGYSDVSWWGVNE